MKLVPKIGDREVTGPITVTADKASLELVNVAVSQALAITTVDQDTLSSVVTVAKELHKLIQAVESSKKLVKRPFLDANKDIEDLAKKIAAPLQAQHDRLTRLLAQWHDAEERRKAEEDRRKREAEAAAEAERSRQAAEEESKRQALLEAQRNATTLEQLEQVNLDLAFHDSEIPINLNFDDDTIPVPRAPIPGATTTKRYKFTLTDPVAAYQYSKQLIRWELSILAAQDIVRSLNEQNLALRIPGVEIITYTDVSTPSR